MTLRTMSLADPSCDEGVVAAMRSRISFALCVDAATAQSVRAVSRGGKLQYGPSFVRDPVLRRLRVLVAGLSAFRFEHAVREMPDGSIVIACEPSEEETHPPEVRIEPPLVLEEFLRVAAGRAESVAGILPFDPPDAPGGLRDTNRRLHSRPLDPWPTYLVAFASNGAGDYYALDTRTVPPSVVYVDPDLPAEQSISEDGLRFDSLEDWHKRVVKTS